jgi:hypothetical protein
VLAFALGFYIMLHRDTTDAGVEDDVKNATDYYPFFDDPFLSMVKTTTMFVGEIEFSDIPIEGPMLPLRYFVVLIIELHRDRVNHDSCGIPTFGWVVWGDILQGKKVWLFYHKAQ